MNVKNLSVIMLMACLTPAVQAHEIWVERDGNGPARIYLGEPENALPEGGDPEFKNLKTPKVLAGKGAPQIRKTGYIETTAPAGDIRVEDDAVFEPWGPAEKKEGVAYYARAGRSEAKSVLAFEIAPATANSDRFILTRNGKPHADSAVKIISPDKWSKTLTTDAQGAITVPLREKGRYLLTAAHKEDGRFDTSLGTVAVLHHITTTTFTVD